MSDFTEMRVCLEKVLARLEKIEEMLIDAKIEKRFNTKSEELFRFSFEPVFDDQGDMVLPEDLVYKIEKEGV